MQQFTSENLDKLRSDLSNTLKALGEEHEITFEVEDIKYSSHNATIELKTTISGAYTQEQRDYIRYADLYNLPELDSIITIKHDERYKLVGWSLKARKYSIIAENLSDGRAYKLGRDIMNYVVAVDKV